MKQNENFTLTLKVTRKTDKTYNVVLDEAHFPAGDRITATEWDSIKEGCALMAKELTQRKRQEVFEDTDPGML